jgi:hypothetical protein
MVIPIRYGDPTHKMLRQYRQGKVYLGGCLPPKCLPKWYCSRDKRKF